MINVKFNIICFNIEQSVWNIKQINVLRTRNSNNRHLFIFEMSICIFKTENLFFLSRRTFTLLRKTPKWQLNIMTVRSTRTRSWASTTWSRRATKRTRATSTPRLRRGTRQRRAAQMRNTWYRIINCSPGLFLTMLHKFYVSQFFLVSQFLFFFFIEFKKANINLCYFFIAVFSSGTIHP